VSRWFVIALVLVAVACSGSSNVTASSTSTSEAAGWTAMPSFVAPGPDQIAPNPVEVWTGRELILPGLFLHGTDRNLGPSPAFDPATRSWRTIAAPPVSMTVPPTGRVAVWSGRELLMFGPSPAGPNATDGATGPTVGAAYNPTTDTWRVLASLPDHRRIDVGVWTGSEVLGYGEGSGVSAYNPATDTWTALPTEPAVLPAPQQAPVTPAGFSVEAARVAWDGSAMVVADQYSGHVLAFTPGGSAWTAMPDVPFSADTLVWNGQQLVAFSGDTGSLATLTPGGPWEQRADGPFQHRAAGASAVWAADRFVVWSGLDFDYSPASTPPRSGVGGASWNPTGNTWTPVVPPPGTDPAPGLSTTGGVAANDQLISWSLNLATDGSTTITAATWSPATGGAG